MLRPWGHTAHDAPHTSQDGIRFGAEPYGFVLLPQMVIPEGEQEWSNNKALRL